MNTRTTEAVNREAKAFSSSILRPSAVRCWLVHPIFFPLEKEGLRVLDFRTDPLFSYTFWLCSLDFVT